MLYPGDLILAAAGLKAGMDLAAESGKERFMGADTPPSTKLRIQSLTTVSREVRTIAVCGRVTALAGCCQLDDYEKRRELYEITQELIESVEGRDTESLPTADRVMAELVKGRSGLHFAFLFARDVTAAGMLECHDKIGRAMQCPHQSQEPARENWREEGDNDISIFLRGQ